MDDTNLLADIDKLVEEEHSLRETHPDGLDDAARQRLADLEEHLDQAWDLLRRRRARRDAGQDPDLEAPRSISTVEDYQQ